MATPRSLSHAVSLDQHLRPPLREFILLQKLEIKDQKRSVNNPRRTLDAVMLFKRGNRQEGKWKLAYFIDARILSRNENKDNELDIRPCVRVFFFPLNERNHRF